MAEVVTFVGGVEYLLSDIAHVGEIEWSTGWPYGCLDAAWKMDLPPNTFPRALAANAHVEIWDGPIRVWAGYLSEPVPGETWSLHAKGWHAAFGNLLALDALASAPSAVPNVAVPAAITRAGLPITVGSALGSTTIGGADETVQANYVLPLLDRYAADAGMRWAVDANYTLTVAADPTTPRYLRDSAEALRGTADDDYVTHVYPRFVSAIDGATGDPTDYGLGSVASNTTPAGRRERQMDLTDLGLLTEAGAEALAQGQLDLNSGRMGYTEPMELAFGELIRPGGSPARLGHVKAGEMLRGFTVADASGAVQLGMTQDVVIGRTTYRDGAKTISVQPVGLAPRTFVDSMRALQPKPTFDGTAA